jgi:hypothetical protein
MQLILIKISIFQAYPTYHHHQSPISLSRDHSKPTELKPEPIVFQILAETE